MYLLYDTNQLCCAAKMPNYLQGMLAMVNHSFQ